MVCTGRRRALGKVRKVPTSFYPACPAARLLRVAWTPHETARSKRLKGRLDLISSYTLWPYTPYFSCPIAPQCPTLTCKGRLGREGEKMKALPSIPSFEWMFIYRLNNMLYFPWGETILISKKNKLTTTITTKRPRELLKHPFIQLTKVNKIHRNPFWSLSLNTGVYFNCNQSEQTLL